MLDTTVEPVKSAPKRARSTLERRAVPGDGREHQGRDVVSRFRAGIFDAGRRFDLVPARANGQPAFGAYLRVPGGLRRGVGRYVLTRTGDRICGFGQVAVQLSVGVAPGLPEARTPKMTLDPGATAAL